ncbi:MAG: FtsX-like permease family protein [Bacteroides sp.]|nr:FtsX-like permease family protein [Bacteroides sp.]
MIIGLKISARLLGISIISFCAVFVCNLFFNYGIDMKAIESELTNEYQIFFYDALSMTATVVTALSGGCLLLTAVVMLFFYIKQYINSHSKELGILKALGYSNARTASSFWIFGVSVFIGTALGYFFSFILMPQFYAKQNEEGILPEFGVSFHFSLFFFLVILPTIGFSLTAMLFAYIKLKRPVMSLLKEIPDIKVKKFNSAKDRSKKNLPFLNELKRATLKTKKTLIFYIAFASFCFSSMTQMSFSMNELSSEMMGIMIMLIGLVLACTTLFIGVSTVVSSNKKTVSMMRVEGYSVKQCQSAIFGGYRPIAYMGFAVGTLYQYILLKIMVEIVFADMESVPDYSFDFIAFIASLSVFLFLYELVMRYCSSKIRKCSVKEIMEGE